MDAPNLEVLGAPGTAGMQDRRWGGVTQRAPCRGRPLPSPMGFLCPRRKARKPQNDNFNVFTHSAKQGRGVHAAHSPRVGALPPEHPTLHLQEPHVPPLPPPFPHPPAAGALPVGEVAVSVLGEALLPALRGRIAARGDVSFHRSGVPRSRRRRHLLPSPEQIWGGVGGEAMSPGPANPGVPGITPPPSSQALPTRCCCRLPAGDSAPPAPPSPFPPTPIPAALRRQLPPPPLPSSPSTSTGVWQRRKLCNSGRREGGTAGKGGGGGA